MKCIHIRLAGHFTILLVKHVYRLLFKIPKLIALVNYECEELFTVM